MSAASSHGTAETFSAYLDAELPAAEAAAVERHLEQCPACRHHLDELAALVRGLRSLERLAPPPLLAWEVERRVALERSESGLAARMEGRSGLGRLEPVVGLGFALVLALALIVFSFLHTVEGRRQGTLPVRLTEDLDHELASGGVAVELAGRRLERQGEGWREVAVEGPPRRRVVVGSDAWRALVAAHSELEELSALDGTVLVRVDGEVLEIE